VPQSLARKRFRRCSALAVALAMTLALAGCGRKGGLDAPPMAAAGDVQTPTQATSQSAAPQQPATPATGTTTQPPDKRKTFLDWLIN
jgi:predicted small lipoprotein YifL